MRTAPQKVEVLKCVRRRYTAAAVLITAEEFVSGCVRSSFALAAATLPFDLVSGSADLPLLSFTMAAGLQETISNSLNASGSAHKQ